MPRQQRGSRPAPSTLIVALLGVGLLASALSPASAAPPPDTPSSSADRGDTAPEFVPGELLVRFEPGTPNSTRRSFRAANALERVEGLPVPGLEKVEVSGSGSLLALADRLARHPAVRYAEPNYILHALDVFPDDPDFNKLWGLHNEGQVVNPSHSAGGPGKPDADIDAPEGWELADGASDVVVAVIDTGVMIAHPDLEDQIWINEEEANGQLGVDDDNNGFIDDVNGWDFRSNNASVYDSASADEHGTHVAGTIAATMGNGKNVVGVSQAQIMPLKFLGGRNGTGSVENAIKAIDYAIKMKADIMNASWGGGGFHEGLQDAITLADEAELLFVAAAGNNGADNDATLRYPSSYPHDNIVAVAATDMHDELAPFSNYGATTVDLGAPGRMILSTVPGNPPSTDFLSGTSMAAPHVTGVAAQVIAAFPTLTHIEVKERLMARGDPIPALAGKTVSGNRLNLATALDTSTDLPEVAIDTPSNSVLSGKESPSLSGTAHSDLGVTDVLVAIQNSDNDHWDGARFVSPEVWLPAHIEPAQGERDVEWTFTWSQAPLADAESFTALVRARNTPGNRNEPESLEITLDNMGPRNVISKAGPRLQPQRDFTVSWSAEDNGGVDSFTVERRAAKFNGGWGAWSAWGETGGATTASTEEGDAVFLGQAGRTYCFRATATDAAGNAATSPNACTAVPLNNTQLQHRGTWAKRAADGYYGASFSRSTKKGARLVRDGIRAKRLALVATKCPKCGTVAIKWRGKVIKRVSLKAASRRTTRIIGLATFSKVQTGKLVVVVKSSGKPVIVEGLGVSRA